MKSKDKLQTGVATYGGTALRFFTICARNFLPSAKILFDSICREHPEANFTVYLCDRDMGYDLQSIGMTVARLEVLGIPNLEQMIRTYSITELCTAIKPYCVLREFALHERASAEVPLNLVYLDPDIELFSPLEEVMEALDSGAQLVLTPHIIRPAERTESDDQKFLQMGVYNLGFIAVRNTRDVVEVMHWWGRRLADKCVIDLAEGLFVDQKWAELLPAFLDNVSIIRHPGYNVAYWNLHERRIHGPIDDPQCNGYPLRFIHYSGLIIEDKEQLSRHSGMFFVSNSFGYGPLVERYRSRLNAPENQRLRNLPFGFFWNSPRRSNEHTPGADQTDWRKQNTFFFAQQFFSVEEYRHFQQQEVRMIASRREYEASLLPKDGGKQEFQSSGYCYLCASKQSMVTSFLYSTTNEPNSIHFPNWREHLACASCNLPNRVRASIHIFLQEFEPNPNARIYITERNTLLFEWLMPRFKNLIGSEYFGDYVGRGEFYGGVRNENLERLSFQSRSFDFLLSFDVLEHVSNPVRAFAEMYRVLQNGGWLIFTAPANLDKYDTIIRAELLSDGRILHHMLPEYHGNPVDREGGALCYRYFGWDVMDMMCEAGFRRPFLFHYWSEQFGYLGPDQVLFVAQKPE